MIQKVFVKDVEVAKTVAPLSGEDDEEESSEESEPEKEEQEEEVPKSK